MPGFELRRSSIGSGGYTSGCSWMHKRARYVQGSPGLRKTRSVEFLFPKCKFTTRHPQTARGCGSPPQCTHLDGNPEGPQLAFLFGEHFNQVLQIRPRRHPGV